VGSNVKKKAMRSIIMAPSWFIWLARNDRIYSEVPVSTQTILDKVKLVDLVCHKWWNFSFSNFLL